MINCEFEDGNKTSLRHVTVNAIVVRDNKVLMGKRGPVSVLEIGKWGLPGGFMERDETLKQTIKRETQEETGWIIKNLELLTIIDNPNRPAEDRQNLSFVYIAQADKKVSEIDGENLEIRWFDLDSLPEKELIAFDFYENLQLYKKYLKEKFTLPILENK
ncbi:MAG: NUDIX hydrolase [Patescibacteria group bacterium]|nr:NUDIX hydrolase [Patescibacteria group bacterium]MDD4304239.1 NUDIX hydrolase [Patescibacteria group bacterium]MDD4695293.1 NUDIX hydrolase [Patescibacteria group bacterium]